MLQAEKLILLTNTPGLMDADDCLIREIGAARVDAMIMDGTIHGGMLPKVRCALEAMQSGVAAAHILDGRVEHALLLDLFTDEGIGTKIQRR